ncbi:MAG TPA: DUF58 domain-containing protein [Saprospiraceae bacterium]|nr:DUF58 domain-containing protein [Saprospiraceae bacterium]HNT21661.1 DUF58 domain-containing protein [Saprospiraceae bacterium]
MDTTELLQKVRKIEIKTRSISKHLFTGEYHSTFKGRGMSFSEVRPYQYGDDIRNIDWNVTARQHEPFVKIFEEERELTLMLMVDISPSSYFGTHQQLKKEWATEICAVLAFSAISNNDKVGLILFSDQIELFIPPKKGKQHILRILRELINAEPRGKGTRVAGALQFFNNILKKRSIAFILSDFWDRDYELPLRILANKHDLIGIQLYDRVEQQLPDIGFVQSYDLETGQLQWIDTSSRSLRKEYEERFAKHLADTSEIFRKSSSDLIQLRTDHSYIEALMAFFKKRAKAA